MKEMTLREVQMVSLDILQDVHEFCVKNGIRYSLSGGSLIGAIRHNGFIPWDDDMDIQMPRSDYEKFIHTYKSEKGYQVFSPEVPRSDVDWIAYPYTRICDTKNTLVDTRFRPWLSRDIGVWIDVFPCDGMPSDELSAKKHMKANFICEKHSYWLGMKYLPWSAISKCYSTKEVLKFIFRKIFVKFVRIKSFDEIMSIKTKYPYETSDYFMATPHYGMGEWQPKKNMEVFNLHKFEDKSFYVMSGYDSNLKSLYGNYMQLPKESKRVFHQVNIHYWRDGCGLLP